MNVYNGKTITVCAEFRKKLIMKVKNHPIVWENSKTKKSYCSVERRDAWKTIEREMGYPCLLKEIQATWASLSETYFRIVFLRTIERNFEPPVWQFFHEMTFLYEHVKETIQNQLGGISPPLFKPRPNQNGAQRPQCPCCIYVGPDSKPDMSPIDVKLEDDYANINTRTSETSLENDQEAIKNPIGSVDSESVQSMCSSEGSNQSCFSTNTHESEHNKTKKDQPASHDSMKEGTLEETWEYIDKLESEEDFDAIHRTRDRMKNAIEKSAEESLNSDNTTLEPLQPLIKDNKISNIRYVKESENYPAQLYIRPKTVADCVNGNPLIQIASIETVNTVNPINISCKKPEQLATPAVLGPNTLPILQNQPMEVIELMDDTEEIYESLNTQHPLESLENVTAINALGTLTQPRIGSNEQLISPGFSELTTKNTLVLNDNSNGKDMAQLVASVQKLRAIKRSQIIQAIKANPGTYLYTCTKKRKLFLEAWNRVAENLGNVPLQGLKNRWKLIKTRYLKELVIERYCNGIQKSSWECFDELEFLRPHMQKDIDEIHRTRDQMKNALKKKEEPIKPITGDTKISNISCVKDSPNDRTGSTKFVTYVNGLPNIQIASVETLNSMDPTKTVCRKPKQLKTPVVLDANTLPILQNRPIKITAVKVLPSTNENDKNEPNNNAEAPPPAKKLRRSTGSERNKKNVLANKTPKILPSPPPPSLTSDMAAAKPATTTKSNCLEQDKPQKVFPTLDLTLDDDLPVTVPTSALEETATSRSIDECIYTCKVFPSLDLTTDENNEDDQIASENEKRIGNSTENGNKKDEGNVICLDDDSVNSFDVIVYSSKQDKIDEK